MHGRKAVEEVRSTRDLIVQIGLPDLRVSAGEVVELLLRQSAGLLGNAA